MRKFLLKASSLFLLIAITSVGCSQSLKLNIVVFGAHPDDADYKVGGSATKWAKKGHNVLFVSITNGDAGHQEMGGRQLAKRRRKEAREAAKRFGIQYRVLSNHDGQLMPTLENREEIIKIIREWKSDIVIGHRPNDYHPDHRNASTLMQDAAYMVIVPNVVPGTPALSKNPVFLYMEDNFQKPQPFNPDICVDISGSYKQKIYAMSAHESQYFEWLPWTSHSLNEVPEGKEERLEWLAKKRMPVITEKERECLIKCYGEEKGSKITMAESFEVCEYGRRPSETEISQLLGL